MLAKLREFHRQTDVLHDSQGETEDGLPVETVDWLVGRLLVEVGSIGFDSLRSVDGLLAGGLTERVDSLGANSPRLYAGVKTELLILPWSRPLTRILAFLSLIA